MLVQTSLFGFSLGPTINCHKGHSGLIQLHLHKYTMCITHEHDLHVNIAQATQENLLNLIQHTLTMVETLNLRD